MVQVEQDVILETIGQNIKKTTLVDSDLMQIELKKSHILFNLLHLNVRSMVRNIDNLILLLESYKLHCNDIIVLSETFRMTSTNHCNIPNYQLFYNHADFNKNDGVIILVKNDVNVEFTNIKLPISKATISRLCCTINNIKIGITATYKPPPISKADFIKDIHIYLDNVIKNSNNIEIFVGDININILNADNDAHNYLATMAQLGFESYINHITRFDSNTCLDHIFVNQRLKTDGLELQSYVLDSHMTDHAPTMLNIVAKNLIKGENDYKEIKISKLDLDKFVESLRVCDWSNVLNDPNPESSNNNFIKTYLDLKNKSTSEHTVKLKQHKKIKEWITNGIITSIKHRDKMKRKLLQNHNIQLENEYKKYRNNLNKIITKQKNDYYKTQLNNINGNIRKLYDIVKKATNENTSTCKTNSIKITNDQGIEFANDREMADHCNSYFASVGSKMAEKIATPRDPIEVNFTLKNSIFLSPINENELIKHISSLKSNSSPGLDGITPKLLKQTHNVIIKPLLHIINRIFVTGIVPSHFKESVITPIHKSGPKTLICNYRPVSLISNFAKVFEKCLKERLYEFLKQYDILSKNQFGFLPGCSTEDALYRVTSEVTNNLNIGKKCAAVFIDLAKAFDTVPHDKLLDTLWHYGIRGTTGRLLQSYLHERYQVVRVNNTLSNREVVKTGVPQGTVLGPILFITYINSLLSLDINGSIISYADDTALIFTGNNWEEVKDKMINGLNVTKLWLESFKLSLNLTKTKYIAFSLTNASRPNFTNIIVENQQINEVAQIKYLGVIVDSFLKWGPHIEHLSNKIRFLIHKFYILREILNTNILAIIYRSLVESLIRYGILIWGGLYTSTLYKLNIVQKCILKVMYKRNRMYPTELLFSNTICSIRTLYMVAVSTFIHKNKSNQSIVHHCYHTRARINEDIIYPINYNNINLKSSAYLGPKIYNMIPPLLKNIKNLRKFSIECRIYISQESKKFENLFKI